MEGAKLVPAVQQQLSFAGVITEGFIVVGSMNQPARIYFAQNLTDVTLQFSMDGTNNHFVLPSGGFLLLDAGTNKGTPNTAAIPQGDGLYVTSIDGSTLPTVGSIYFSYWYAA